MASRHDGALVEQVTIAGAAELLGVSLITLRRWDASGKFRARRHPINSYRIYALADVMRLKRLIAGSTRPSSAPRRPQRAGRRSEPSS